MWQQKYMRAIRTGKQLIGDKVMRKAIVNCFSNDCILDEVRFDGFIADMLFINPEQSTIVGVEVKSDRDDFDKLEHQLRGYLKWCNVVFLATTIMHEDEALNILNNPEFANVGLLIYVMKGDEKYFTCLKKPVWADVYGVGSEWVSKKHKLYQWLYLLELIWG